MILCIRRLVAVMLSGQPLPQHVAFIMDGNRRFADQLNLQRIDGHKHGYNKMKDIIQWCLELGISCISVYAFSIDNFKRPQEEVDSLMELARLKFEELLHDEDARKWGAELRVIGDLSKAPASIQSAAAKLMQGSKKQGPTKAVVNICFAYTSTQELQHSVQQLVNGIHHSHLVPDDITPALLQQLMHTRDCPPVDLLIRTSGEQRLSDFLVWQSSHALLHWEPCLWPEFGYTHLLRALLAWQQAEPTLSELRTAAAEVTAAAVAAQQQAAASLNGASSPPRVSSCAAVQGYSAIVQQQLQQSSVRLQEFQQQQQQQQRSWWGKASGVGQRNLKHDSSIRGHDGGSSSSSSSSSSSPAGLSPERSSSMALSMISEDMATHCPHPSQKLRVESYVQQVEREYAANVQLLAAS